MAEFAMIAMGCTICYADPKSLTATGAYPKGALEAYSPTLMAAVPKIWDVIRKGLLAKVDAGPAIAKFLVHTALDWKQFAISIGLTTPLFNALVIKKFRAAIGGKLRYALSGGGPLNGEVQDFIRAAFDIKFVQGYVRRHCCCMPCTCSIVGRVGLLVESHNDCPCAVVTAGIDGNLCRGGHPR